MTIHFYYLSLWQTLVIFHWETDGSYMSVGTGWDLRIWLRLCLWDWCWSNIDGFLSDSWLVVWMIVILGCFAYMWTSMNFARFPTLTLEGKIGQEADLFVYIWGGSFFKTFLLAIKMYVFVWSHIVFRTFLEVTLGYTYRVLILFLRWALCCWCRCMRPSPRATQSVCRLPIYFSHSSSHVHLPLSHCCSVRSIYESDTFSQMWERLSISLTLSNRRMEMLYQRTQPNMMLIRRVDLGPSLP